MGYDAEIVIFKKKTLDKFHELISEYSFSELYSEYLFTRLHPDDYIVPEDEKATLICTPFKDIFNEFFGKFENDEARIIDKETYFQFYNWLERKLKETTLYDLTGTEVDERYIETLIDTYKSIRDNPIDFETEFVIFQHDW